MSNALLELRDVYFSWSRGAEPVMKGVNLRLKAGEMAAVIGPNGAGKSTLLRLASGYLKPDSGEVFIGGVGGARLKRREAARRVAMVPQYSSIFLPYTVEELARLGRFPWRGLLGRWSPADARAVANAMEVTAVAELADRPVTDLSGGEFQRAVVAKALAQEPDLLLLDEPTAHLDIAYQMHIFEIISRLNKSRGLAVLAVLHDINLASAFFERVILIAEGRIRADGPRDSVVTRENISAAFGWPVRVLPHGDRFIIVPERSETR